MKTESSTCQFTNGDSWVILSPIEQSIKNKIEAVGTPLKDWDINIYRGVLTGCNEAFIISTDKRNEILANCKTAEERKKTEELIRPILRGRDIKRYSYDWAELWLIYIPWHFPLHLDATIQGNSEKAEKAFQEQYPAVYAHLLCYKKQLSARNKAETGIRYEWYAMQRWGANYWEDFFRPKIIYSEIVREPQFYLDNSCEFFPEATVFILTGANLEYLTALLHTKCLTYCFKTFYAGGGLGEEGYRYKKAFLVNLPIPAFENLPLQNEIIELINQQLQNNDPELDKHINDKVYEIYNLTTEEISYIENSI